MKRVLYFCKIFSFCLLICYVFYSCAHSKVAGYADKDARKVVIKIKHGDIITKKLDMFDKDGNSADSVLAWSRQVIKWKIVDTANVKSIKNISQKDTANIFSRKPHKKTLKKWKGKLKDASQKEDEEYYIEWKDENGTFYKYDPYIQVNPR